MNALHLIFISIGFVYLVLPYLLLIRLLNSSLRKSQLPGSVSLALALFVLCAMPIMSFSLNAYLWTHACLLVVGMVGIVSSGRQTPKATSPIQMDKGLLAIAGLAFVSRLIPPLIGGDPLGMGDARYHNIISQLLLIQGQTPYTWQPFADVGLTYPQAIHGIVAFVASICRLPVHEVFVIAFAPVAALTVFSIFRLTVLIGGSLAAGRLASAIVAFLPTWNSLDYYAWGGLPNALAMVFLLEAIAITLSWVQGLVSDTSSFSLPAAQTTCRTSDVWIPAMFFSAIVATHHYTVIVGALYMLALWTCSLSNAVRKQLLMLTLATILMGSYALVRHYLQFTDTIGSTGVLIYREQITRLVHMKDGLGIPLLVLVGLALTLRRRTAWSARELVVFGWMVSLLMAFCFLAYGYRALTLWATGGQDMYCALTPSRMIATLVYPLSILAGLLTLTPFWAKRHPLIILCTGLACFSMTAAAMSSQIRGDEFPSVIKTGNWLTNNSPTNSMLVGVVPHIEYTSLRETAEPPLPASERRHSEQVLWKKELTTYSEWLEWSAQQGRPVYFLLPHIAQPPPIVQPCYSNEDFVLYTRTP